LQDPLLTDLFPLLQLCPDYEALELGIGESILINAIAESTSRTKDKIKADYKQHGDLGLVAQESKASQKLLFQPAPLTVPFVFNKLKAIALAGGTGAQKKKVDLIQQILVKCVGVETKFIIRSLEGKLRIGLAERTVVVSLAHAIVKSGAAKSGKKYSKETMAEKLEHGAEVVKQVFS